MSKGITTSSSDLFTFLTSEINKGKSVVTCIAPLNYIDEGMLLKLEYYFKKRGYKFSIKENRIEIVAKPNYE